MAKCNYCRPLLDLETTGRQADTLAKNEQQTQADRCTGYVLMDLRDTIINDVIAAIGITHNCLNQKSTRLI